MGNGRVKSTFFFFFFFHIKSTSCSEAFSGVGGNRYMYTIVIIY